MTDTPITTAGLLRTLDQVLADLDGPDPIITRIDIARRDLALLRFRLRQLPPGQGLPAGDTEGRSEDSLSRIALLFAAVLTSDSFLHQAAEDVLPAHPGDITYRRHIENWLRGEISCP